MKGERSSDQGLERFISIQNALRTAGALAIGGAVYGVLRAAQHFRQLPEASSPNHDGYSALKEPEEGINTPKS